MALRVHFHDNTPAKPGEAHGDDGPTHCGSVTVDYEYQVEMWVFDEIDQHSPKIHRVRCPAIQREWKRDEAGKMKEVPWDPTPPVHVTPVSLHERVANVLGCSTEEAQSISLPNLRDLVRLADHAALADEITVAIQNTS